MNKKDILDPIKPNHKKISMSSQQIEVKSLDKYLLVDGVEFVGLISKNGRLVDCKSKNNLCFTKQQEEMYFMSISLYHSMQRDYDENFGLMEYTIMVRENYKIISIPMEKETLVVVINKSGNFANTVDAVLDCASNKVHGTIVQA